ncbi:hypothetical protein KEM55_000515 [Ascosphaera atra]|nr:hypothetical protein KEM55_000515 [Ascosphaera atra]
MSWQPEEGQLQQLIQCLGDSLNGRNRTAQKNAEQMLLQATSSPDFTNYLTYLFHTPQAPLAGDYDHNVIRVAAAVNLKSKIKVAYQTIAPQSLAYIKTATLEALQDTNPSVRNAAGSIITEIITQGGLLQWPDLLPQILALATNASGSTNVVTQEAAVSALAKICEDNTKLLDRDFQGQRPLAAIIPALVQCTSSPSDRIRADALSTINLFIARRPGSLVDGLDMFLQQLFHLASDSSSDVRRMVCKSFTHIAEVAPDKVAPHMDGLVNYILIQQHNADDPELALDAAEFWLGICDHAVLQQALAPHIPKVIPVLLENMVYDEDDAEILMGADDDADEEDAEKDLKPQFASSRAAKVQGDGFKKAGEEEEDELSEGEIDDDDDYGDDPEEEWTVRKCSAASLDVFATIYMDPVFHVVLPYLKDNLNSPNWTRRESAVLALGAIANGCMNSIVPHLPGLVPYLVSLLKDEVPIVRKITCWCLGRYSDWAAALPDEQKRLYFEPMVQGLLQLMLDKNKKVQEAAASGFTSLEEKSGAALAPYCKPILLQFSECFRRYKARNLYVLYDCVQTLATAVDVEMAKPELIEILMPALISRWNILPDDAREMLPLLECLGYVAVAYRDAFAPFAPTMYTRALQMIYNNIQGSVSAMNNGTIDEPDKDFLITALDLVSAIFQALEKPKPGELVTSSQPPLFEMLHYCLQDPISEVKISAYALLGDSAVNLFEQLDPYIPSMMPTLLQQLDLDQLRMDDEENGLSVVNNACWAAGEIVLRLEGRAADYLEGLYKALVIIMANEEVPETVVENATVALGRLGVGCAEQLAPHLANFAAMFLRTMENVYVTSEKGTSFIGFNQIVMRNPKALEDCLQEYITAIATFNLKELPEDERVTLRQSFYEVCAAFAITVPEVQTP